MCNDRQIFLQSQWWCVCSTVYLFPCFSPLEVPVPSLPGVSQQPPPTNPMSSVISSSVSLVVRSSPARSRRRSRYRHNNSPVATPTASIVGILKSPAKHSTAVVNIRSNPVADGCYDNVTVTPSSRLRRYGPGAAVCSASGPDQRRHSEGRQSVLATEMMHNLNDVCFGCDGHCSDPACTTRKPSTKARRLAGSILDPSFDGNTVSRDVQSKLRRVSNPLDLNASEIEDSENGNTQSSNSPTKAVSESTTRGQVSPRVLSSKLKCLCSNGDADSPSKKGHPRTKLSTGRVCEILFLSQHSQSPI